jgi:hypothetical protein
MQKKGKEETLGIIALLNWSVVDRATEIPEMGLAGA